MGKIVVVRFFFCRVYMNSYIATNAASFVRFNCLDLQLMKRKNMWGPYIMRVRYITLFSQSFLHYHNARF